MANKPKIELQPVQQAVYQQTKPFTRDSMGYTNRPIDQRTQVRNIYLDNITFYGSIENIPSTETYYLDTPTSISKVGKLNRNEVNSNFTLKVPVSGTYLLLGKVFPEFDGTGSALIEIKKNGSTTLVFYFINSVITNIDTSFNNVVLLEKGDTIQFLIDNQSDDLLDVNLDISITKIS